MVKRLRELRQKSGLSQQQLADILVISQQSVNKYENHNVEPDIATLIAMADYFNTSVDYLIGNTDIDHLIETVTKFDLNKDEEALMKNYRNLAPNEKSVIQDLIKTIAEK